MPEPTQEQLTAAYRKAITAFGNREFVAGIDVGFVYESQVRHPDRRAVRIHVEDSLLHPFDVLKAQLPSQIDGVPVCVIPGTFRLHHAPASPPPFTANERRKLRKPLQPGISVGNAGRAGGTLGLIVFDLATGGPMILSCRHVLAPLSGNPQPSIVQPSFDDHGFAPTHTIAEFRRATKPVEGDAAVGMLNKKRKFDLAQFDTGGLVVRSVARAQVGDVVRKSGVSTLVTTGVVDGVGRYYLSGASGDRAGMDGFKIVPEQDGNPTNVEISAHSDSGAVWFRAPAGSTDGVGVGVHVAGEENFDPRAEHGIACHLDTVLRALDVWILPPPAKPPAAPAGGGTG